MKIRSALFAMQLAAVAGLAVPAYIAAPPGVRWWLAACSLLVGIGLATSLRLAGQKPDSWFERKWIACGLAVLSVIMLFLYFVLHEKCVVRSTRYRTWQASPVYFPLVLRGAIADEVRALGSRTAIIDKYGPGTIRLELERMPNYDWSLSETTALLTTVWLAAFAPITVVVSIILRQLFTFAERSRIERSLARRFRVALSFPGEHRKFAEEVAEYLGRMLGRREVFYDKWYEAELARIDLHLYLRQIYATKADLLVVFLCADYERKQFCRLEWRKIHELIDEHEGERIMLIRIDDGDVTGVCKTDGYISVEGRSALEIAEKIAERWKLIPAAENQEHSH